MLRFFLCVLLPFFSHGQSNLRIRLNRPGFDFLSKTLHDIVDEEVPKVVLPPINIPIGSQGSITVSEMKVKQFTMPKFTMNLSTEGVSSSSYGGRVKISSLFTVEYTIIFPVEQSGWVDAYAKDFLISLSATSTVRDGRPQIAIQECNARVEHFDIEIGGGVLPWLVNLFRDALSQAIKNAINDQACTLAQDLLATKGNEFLHSLPTTVALGKNFFIHYNLNTNPSFTSEYMELESIVNITYGEKNLCKLPFVPLGKKSSSSRMSDVWVGEQIPNCLLHSAFSVLSLSVTITHENVPLIADYLKTTCLFTCIGFYFPTLASKYPNEHVALTLSPAGIPSIHLAHNSSTLITDLFVDVFIYPKHSNSTSLARMKLSTSGSLQVSLRERLVIGHVNSVAMNATTVFSSIGEFSPKFLEMFSSLFSRVVPTVVNVLLEKHGFPIPVFDNLTVSDASIVSPEDSHVFANIDFQEVERKERRRRRQ